jgi:thioredoxin-like negative regulator of GroEL
VVTYRRWQPAVVLSASLVVAACSSKSPPPVVAAKPVSSEALPFIHDDYPRALAEAKRLQRPLFVDSWASWCHSCQSLRAYVLTDPLLTDVANDFVWLSIDTEKDVNTPFLERYPHSALPTLWIIDPATSRPILKWAGTATANELRELLSVAVSDAHGAGGPVTESTAAFVRGNRALAAGDLESAEKEHRAALEGAPKNHPHRGRIIEALVTLLALKKDHAACADVAAAEAPIMASDTSRASVIVNGLGCAREIKRTKQMERLLEIALRDAASRSAPLLPDDRSALYEEAVAVRKELGDARGARKTAMEWASFLDGEAKRAKSIDARSSLDPLRLNAFLALEEPAHAIPMLQQSEQDFPDDYNPPFRLARVYLEMKRLDEASRAIERAIVRVYGPRAMRVFGLKADIAKARGDKAGEVKALEQALSRSDKAVLTDGQRAVRDILFKRLAALK